jgi:DNA-directed RNA polymerase subunit RPC12/RpoP
MAMKDDINLQEGRISVDGEWLSATDISCKIMDKIQAGDTKIADLANALERLVTGMENSHTLDVRVVLSRSDYDRLVALGKEDDTECLRKAVRFFINAPDPLISGATTDPRAREALKTALACVKCGTRIEIPDNPAVLEIDCPFCGTSHVLAGGRHEPGKHSASATGKETTHRENGEPRHKDHYIG